VARYSTFQYGTQTYGGGRGVTRSTLLAQVTSYSTISVTLTTPLRVGDRYMLVRTYNGAAEHPTAGLTVADGVIINTEFTLIDGVSNYADSDLNNDIALSPGWVYYTLFVFDESGAWIKEAATSVVLPADRGTLDYLVKALPSIYTAPDANPITPPTLDSDLARFLSGITLTYDEMASSVDNVLPDVRARATIRRLHDAYATGVGMPSEYTIGVAATARLYRESGFIYRNKGTARGIEAYVEALTGWQTTVTESPNRFLNRDDSSFESGVGDWTTTGGTLTRVVVNEPSVTSSKELYPYDTTVLPWAQEAVGQFALTASSGTMTLPYVKAGSLPVTGGNVYRFEVPVKATSGTPSVTLYIDWYSQSGSLISTSTSTTTSSTSAWASNFFTATAPNTATSVALRITVAGSIGNTVHLDMLSFTDTDDYIDGQFVYRDPRSVTVLCTPVRTNLMKDPSVVSDIGDYWSAEAGVLIKDSTVALIGVSSAKVTGTPFSFKSHTVAVVAGESYAASASALGTGSCDVRLVWLTDILDEISEVTAEFEALSSSGWTSASVAGVAPEGAAFALLRFTGTGDVNVDAMVFEQAARAGVFFDGSVADASGADSSWVGTAGESHSVLYPQRLVKLARLTETLDYYVPHGVTWRVLLWDADDPEAVAARPS
jgi:hypothetical protein